MRSEQDNVRRTRERECISLDRNLESDRNRICRRVGRQTMSRNVREIFRQQSRIAIVRMDVPHGGNGFARIPDDP